MASAAASIGGDARHRKRDSPGRDGHRARRGRRAGTAPRRHRYPHHGHYGLRRQQREHVQPPGSCREPGVGRRFAARGDRDHRQRPRVLRDRFRTGLRGKTITLREVLPVLIGGGVSIEGDIDGDGAPDVTLKAKRREEFSRAIEISSSLNRVHGLVLQGFGVGVEIYPRASGGRLARHRRLSGNVVSGLVIRGYGDFGVLVDSASDSRCGVPKPKPCRTFDTFANTTVTGNEIQASDTGIKFSLSNSGDRVQGATVTHNRIEIRGPRLRRRHRGRGRKHRCRRRRHGGKDLRGTDCPQLNRGRR